MALMAERHTIRWFITFLVVWIELAAVNDVMSIKLVEPVGSSTDRIPAYAFVSGFLPELFAYPLFCALRFFLAVS